MIEKDELERFARLRRLSLGNAEKDYLLDMALLSISASTKNELVFKGGTCLYKFHKLPRFSEDLDFSATQDVDADRLIGTILSDFARFGVEARLVGKKAAHESVLATLRAQGPLFSGNPLSSANLGLDINLKSKPLLEPEALTYHSPYPEIPAFTVLCMKAEEILAEKVRALMTRTKARDLFDTHFLLQKGVDAGAALIGRKMDYYHERFSAEALRKRLAIFEPFWKKEMRGFTPDLPEFGQARASVDGWLRRRF